MRLEFDYNNRYDWRKTRRWKTVRLQVLSRDGGVCQVRGPRCRGIADTVDHIIPVVEAASQGLTPVEANGMDNLRAACTSCNSSLGTRLRNARASGRPEAIASLGTNSTGTGRPNNAGTGRPSSTTTNTGTGKVLADWDPTRPFNPEDYHPDDHTIRGFHPATYSKETGKDANGIEPNGNYFNPRWF